MSVLTEFAMFPTDQGESVSQEVSKVIKMIRHSGISYQLTPMGTIIETDTIEEAMELIIQSYKILEPHANRVYSSIKLDIRKDTSNRIHTKIQSIEEKIGEVNK